MADARDLKSRGSKMPYGFKSHLGHQFGLKDVGVKPHHLKSEK